MSIVGKTTYLKDIAYDVLRERILNCTYAPGSILNVANLMGELGFSRTPIQNAMVRLQEENFVTIIPKKGIIVRGITLREILEVLEIRLLIEPHLIIEYGNEVDKQTLTSFIAQSKEATNSEEILHLHAIFNNMLYTACRNQRMQEILLNLEAQNQRNRNWRPDANRVAQSGQENLQTAEYLLQNDVKKAARSARKHLENAQTFAMTKYV